jgi:hypothetical protein
MVVQRLTGNTDQKMGFQRSFFAKFDLQPLCLQLGQNVGPGGAKLLAKALGHMRKLTAINLVS